MIVNTNEELEQAFIDKVVDIIIETDGLQLLRERSECPFCKITMVAPLRLNDIRGWLLFKTNADTATFTLGSK